MLTIDPLLCGKDRIGRAWLRQLACKIQNLYTVFVRDLRLKSACGDTTSLTTCMTMYDSGSYSVEVLLKSNHEGIVNPVGSHRLCSL